MRHRIILSLAVALALACVLAPVASASGFGPAPHPKLVARLRSAIKSTQPGARVRQATIVILGRGSFAADYCSRRWFYGGRFTPTRTGRPEVWSVQGTYTAHLVNIGVVNFTDQPCNPNVDVQASFGAL